MKKFLILIPAIIFLIAATVTLSDYGISWDEPIHFFRGQAYLHFFLTGKTDFKDIVSDRKSFYQNDSLTANYFINNDSGHPPLNGILASGMNSIFYQKMNLLGDIESYHLFNVLVSFVLILIVAIFAYLTYGIFASFMSSSILILYPLFFAESHFNIKDPAETALITLTIFSFWKSLEKWSVKWLLLSILSFAFAWGIKFNILFVPLVILPYLAVRFYLVSKGHYIKLFRRIPVRYLLTLISAPLIIIIIFFAIWPFLWQNPLDNFLSILGYYKTIGTGDSNQPGFFVWGGFNLYPAIWIFITTPIYTILLVLAGIYFGVKSWKEKSGVLVLWLLLFLLPIIRVTIPHTSIYGGVRQIMEFLPGLALLCGFGAKRISDIFIKSGLLKNRRILIRLVLILFLIPNIWILVTLHPNQNVYFNSIIGGLEGAKQNKIPYWGYSFGNAYKMGIDWINSNAEPNAKLALIQGTSTNVPKNTLRSDIQYSNQLWSGINRQGEYLLELTYNDPLRVYPYEWDYVNTFLNPVYEVKVDNVPIAKVWKNDLKHTKKEFKKKEAKLESPLDIEIVPDGMLINLTKKVDLSRIMVSYEMNTKCSAISGFVYTYNGQKWVKEEEGLPGDQVTEVWEKNPNKIRFFFPKRSASKIKLEIKDGRSCIFNNPEVEVLIFK